MEEEEGVNDYIGLMMDEETNDIEEELSNNAYINGRTDRRQRNGICLSDSEQPTQRISGYIIKGSDNRHRIKQKVRHEPFTV